MKTTTTYGISYPESGDHTRTWEYWQSLATKVDDLLAGRAAALNIANDVTVGDPTSGTERVLRATRLNGGVVLAAKYRVQASGGGGGQGTIASFQIDEDGAEAAQLNYRRDGQLFMKSGGAAGVSRLVPFATWAGFVTVNGVAATTVTATVTFPANRFTQVPVLVGAAKDSNLNVGWTSGATAASMPFVLRAITGTSIPTVDVALQCLQMTPTSAQG